MQWYFGSSVGSTTVLLSPGEKKGEYCSVRRQKRECQFLNSGIQKLFKELATS